MSIDRWVGLLTDNEKSASDFKASCSYYRESWFNNSNCLDFGVKEDSDSELLLSLHGCYLTDIKHILLSILNTSTSLSKEFVEETINSTEDTYKKVWVWFE